MASGKYIVHRSERPFDELFSSMKEFRSTGKYCDIVLKVENREIPAHRIILASAIPYFQALFRFDNPEGEVQVESVEAAVLEQLIDYVYSGKIRIDDDNAESLIMGASFLQMSSVFSACGEFLASSINTENVLRRRKLAGGVSHCALIDATEKFIQDNLTFLIDKEDFLNLEKDEVISIIQLDDLCIKSEDDILNACLKWIKYKEESRKKLLDDFIDFIRLSHVSLDLLKDLASKEVLVTSSAKCLCLVQQAQIFQLNPQMVNFPVPEIFKSKPRAFRIYTVGHVENHIGWIQTLEILNPVSNIWQKKPRNEQESIERRKFGVAALDRKIYVIGGENKIQYLTYVEVYDIKKRQWSQAKAMLKRRSAFGAVVVNNMIYVCGGYDGSQRLCEVECYSPKLNQWKPVASMKASRGANAVAVLNDKIYVIGGWGYRDPLNVVECYNPRKNTWTYKCPMLKNRAYHCVVVFNNKIYAIGGYDGDGEVSSVEVYDAEWNEWYEMKPMLNKRAQAAAAVYKGKIWVTGGCNNQGMLPYSEIYDPVSNEWSIGPKSVEDRYVYGAICC